MQRPFYFEAKSKDEVNIHIYGGIGWDETQFGDGTNNTAYALVSLIKRLDKDYKRINVHINSPGGSIEHGLAIFNTLKQANAEIHTYNSGLVASMASVIMLAGKTHMPKTSVFHLHSASTIAMGNINDFQQVIDSLRVFEEILQQAIADKTNMNLVDIKNQWFDGAEHYMTASKASELGFVDFLEDEAVKPPAPVDQLVNMTFNEVEALYERHAQAKTEGSFMDRIKSLFITNNTNLNNEVNMSKQMVFKAKLTLLLAIIGIEQFVANADNKIELDVDQAYRINDELETRNAENDALKQQNIQLSTQVDALNARNNELQAIIDKTPQSAANPKGGDNSQVDEPEDVLVMLDDETSAKIHLLNKQNGTYR